LKLTSRLQEGNGEAYYFLGLEDDGNSLGINVAEMRESLATLFILARNLNAELTLVAVKRGTHGYITENKIRVNELEKIKLDIKITMMGSEGAGKSTLLGVLISGKSDNGVG
jgi:small GTP-binding protein